MTDQPPSPHPAQPYPAQPHPGQPPYAGPGYPGTFAPGPVVLSPLPERPVEYHQLLRTPRNRWWKGALAIVSLVAGFFVVSLVLSGAAIAIDVATGRSDPAALQSGKIELTPLILLATNLGAAAMIPLSLLLQWGFFGQRPRWMHSVRGTIRWRLMGKAALIVVPLWAVYVGLSYAFSPAGTTKAFSGETIALLVIVVLTTPLQSMGEEYGARGLINKAAGSWLADRRWSLVVGALVSSVLFMFAHGAGDPWLNAYYFVFGLGMAVIVWRTGGLEVSSLVHATNNFLLFVVGISLGQDMSQTFDRADGAGSPVMLVGMAIIALAVAVIWWWSGRHQVSRTYDPLVLSATGPAGADRH